MKELWQDKWDEIRKQCSKFKHTKEIHTDDAMKISLKRALIAPFFLFIVGKMRSSKPRGEKELNHTFNTFDKLRTPLEEFYLLTFKLLT